jgi:spermidine/putrescine-binding protein
MDLSKLSEYQLQKMIAAGGDLSKLSTEDINHILSTQEKTFTEKATDVAKDYGLPLLSGAAKALDYAGGVARTTGAAALMLSLIHI